MVYIESLFHFSIAKISFSFCNSVAKGNFASKTGTQQERIKYTHVNTLFGIEFAKRITGCTRYPVLLTKISLMSRVFGTLLLAYLHPPLR